MNIDEKREKIRLQSLLKRGRLSVNERTLRSKQIIMHVIDWIEQSEKKGEGYHLDRVMVYLSMKGEVDTEALIEYLINQGKQIIAPVVDEDKIQLIPRQIQDVELDLVRHTYGMLQPKASCPVVSSDQLQLIIVPGIAFDMRGYRIGFGKGFYDRFLPTCCNVITIGIAFQLQIVNDTYPQSWDIPVKHVFTENGML